MTTIDDFQFELQGVPFGIGQDITVEDGGFDPGEAEWTVQDADIPNRPATAFGSDILRGPTWAFQLSSDTTRGKTALDAVSRLATAWRSTEVVSEPGAMLTLRYGLPGRMRRVYGRGRRWRSAPSNRLMGGYVPISCDFKTADALHYDDVERSAILQLNSTSVGGFTFPLTFPFTTLPSTDRAGQVTSLGDAYTYPVIRIEGPITNPWVRHNNWRLDFSLSLGALDYVEIDTRPWVFSVLKNGTGNVANTLSRRNKLAKVRIKPGTQEITFGGSGSSGTPKCVVTWRDAWNSL